VISKRTKVVIYKTIHIPIVTYSSESWAMNSNTQSAIQACEMRFLIKIEGKTRRDRIRNKIIREIVGVQSTQEYVKRSQLRWYGHVNRMDDKRIVKRVYEAREIGKRSRGRPRKTRKEGLQEVTRKKGVTWKEVERTIKDREKWKALWNLLCTERWKRTE
jgi:hypothetical protein